MINNIQIAPLTALQKLLSSNQPLIEKHNDSQKYKSLQKSIQFSSTSELFNHPIKNKISTPKNGIDSSLRRSVGKLNNDSGLKGTHKNDFLHILKKASIKSKKIQDLNHLLSPQNKMCDSASYKQKRPPLLQYLGEENEKQNLQSSKSVENQIRQNKYSSGRKTNNIGFFTSTHQRSELLGSINNLLKQYIQNKSQQKQAGTGEGIQVCRSARNTDSSKQDEFENKDRLIVKQKSDYTKVQKNTLQDQLHHLFMKTQKVLAKYKMKEALWKQQKMSLKEEIKLLKQLLQQ